MLFVGPRLAIFTKGFTCDSDTVLRAPLLCPASFLFSFAGKCPNKKRKASGAESCDAFFLFYSFSDIGRSEKTDELPGEPRYSHVWTSIITILLEDRQQCLMQDTGPFFLPHQRSSVEKNFWEPCLLIQVTAVKHVACRYCR